MVSVFDGGRCVFAIAVERPPETVTAQVQNSGKYQLLRAMMISCAPV